VTSVDVVVVRTNPQLHEGAATVWRTLGRDDARALARAVDQPPLAWVNHLSCPAMLGGERWSDRLTFHAGARTLTFLDDLAGCQNLTVTADSRTESLGGSIDAQVLHALGLPQSYGR
jgi:hypothetical protein